jgi:hypothetical protein
MNNELRRTKVTIIIEEVFKITGRPRSVVTARLLHGELHGCPVFSSEKREDRWRFDEFLQLGGGVKSYKRQERLRAKGRLLLLAIPLGEWRKIYKGEVFHSVEDDQDAGSG